MPTIITARLHAQEQGETPNEQFGVGVIGAGRRSAQLIGELQRFPEARFVAVADVDTNRAMQWADQLKAEPCQDYRRLLERDDVDAIICGTTDHWRAIICIEACQAGMDVYAEKPMTLTIREGRLMADAVRKYDRVFQTGTQQRSLAANRHGCELIRNGRLGRIERVISANYPSPWHCAFPAQPVPDGLDWDMWCGPTEVVPYHIDLYTPRANPGWISFRPYSGGEMTGWGAHGFDQIQWALGMDESGPLEVWTEGEPFDPPTYTEPEGRARGEEICRNPKVFMRYEGDVVMELGNGPGAGAIFVGENGSITIDRGTIKSDPDDLVEETIGDDEERLYVSDNHMGNWVECIRTRERCVADVEIGHRSATVCHLGNIARELGRPLKWDPVAERFDGDDAANGLLDRERRTPWLLPERI